MSGRYYNQKSIEEVDKFYAAIDSEKISRKLSAERPYVYTTLEVYDLENGIRGAGGLGILAADTRRVAQDLEVPFVMITPFYQTERHQKVENFVPEDYYVPRKPEDFGFAKIGQIAVHVRDAPDANLDIYEKKLGSTRFLSMTEPNFGALYDGSASDDHRLYQMVSLGFGGYAALKMSGLKPAVMQLNETATTFAAVARLDELCANGMNLYEALVYVRSHSLYTNHTLLQAAEPSYTLDQFERFVFPNIKSPALRHFVGGLFRDGRLVLNSLTLEIAGAKNCVSKLHAKVIDYHDLSGERVEFRAITNGIHMPTWVDPSIMKFYRSAGVIDTFGMPAATAKEKIAAALAKDPTVFRKLKSAGRAKLNAELAHRKDQYGQAIQIPADAKLFEFKRRFVSYKRPWMPFEDLDRLKKILLDNNAHYIMAGMMAGNVAAGDETYDHLQNMFHAIENDPVLRERVHYITDYDEKLAAAMAFGSDVSINVPEVGWEACGTSFMKDIANLTVLVSTNDGGVADVEPPAILLVEGKDYAEETDSLYRELESAGKILCDDEAWTAQVARQLTAYLPTIAAPRMLRDYLQFLFRTGK